MKIFILILSILCLAGCATPKADIEMVAYAAESEAGSIRVAENQHERTLRLLNESHENQLAKVNASFAERMAEIALFSNPSEAAQRAHGLTLEHTNKLLEVQAQYNRELSQMSDDLTSARKYAKAPMDIVRMQKSIQQAREQFAQETIAQSVVIAGEFYTQWQAQEEAKKAERERQRREAELDRRERELAEMEHHLNEGNDQ